MLSCGGEREREQVNKIIHFGYIHPLPITSQWTNDMTNVITLVTHIAGSGWLMGCPNEL